MCVCVCVYVCMCVYMSEYIYIYIYIYSVEKLKVKQALGRNKREVQGIGILCHTNLSREEQIHLRASFENHIVFHRSNPNHGLRSN